MCEPTLAEGKLGKGPVLQKYMCCRCSELSKDESRKLVESGYQKIRGPGNVFTHEVHTCHRDISHHNVILYRQFDWKCGLSFFRLHLKRIADLKLAVMKRARYEKKKH